MNQKLAEIGQPVSDTQKKTFFLNGIKDKNYTAMKSLCSAQQYTFEKCVLEMRRESIQNVEVKKTESDSRKANNVRSNEWPKKGKSFNRGNNKKKLRIPSNIWKQMSQEQKSA